MFQSCSGQASNLAELLTCAVVSFGLLKLLLALSLTLTMIETLNVKAIAQVPPKTLTAVRSKLFLRGPSHASRNWYLYFRSLLRCFVLHGGILRKQ